MSSLNWMQLAIDADFQLRVQAGINYVVISIVNESINVPNHKIRLIIAKKMINGFFTIDRFSKLVCVDSDIRSIIDAAHIPSDAELLAAVERTLVVVAKARI